MKIDATLQLFRERASAKDDHASYEEMVNGLATLLAASRGRLSKETFDHLIDLGGTLYKAGLSQYRARDEVGLLMEQSVADRRNDSTNDTPVNSQGANL